MRTDGQQQVIVLDHERERERQRLEPQAQLLKLALLLLEVGPRYLVERYERPVEGEREGIGPADLRLA